MVLNKNDFIEIEFVARVKEGDVFDTNISEELKKAKLQIKKVKPYILSIGHEMVIKGFDEDLDGKEEGSSYSIEIEPKKAFGKRNPQLVKMIPMNAFKEQNILPQRGMQFDIDGQVVRIVSISGGRVLTDFNHPLAGKTVIYDYKILRKVTDKTEQINAVQEFLFGKTFPFTINKNELLFEVDQHGMDQYIEMVSKAFEDIVGMTAKAKVIEKKIKDKKTD